MHRRLMLSAVLCLAAGLVAVAHSQERQKAEPVDRFLTSDGRFDLEAARRAGYQGPLDFKGFEAAVDPSTGEANLCLFGPTNGPEVCSAVSHRRVPAQSGIWRSSYLNEAESTGPQRDTQSRNSRSHGRLPEKEVAHGVR